MAGKLAGLTHQDQSFRFGIPTEQSSVDSIVKLFRSLVLRMMEILKSAVKVDIQSGRLRHVNDGIEIDGPLFALFFAVDINQNRIIPQMRNSG